MATGRLVTAVLAGLALFSSISSAEAQYYPYPQPPPRPYYGPGPGYGGPQYGGYDYYTPRRRVALGNVCDTSRGACQFPPTPVGSACRCRIPGFGKKRGVVVGQPNW
jgi:hypothetical protein